MYTDDLDLNNQVTMHAFNLVVRTMLQFSIVKVLLFYGYATNLLYNIQQHVSICEHIIKCTICSNC